jgi:hypothetical protein
MLLENRAAQVDSDLRTLTFGALSLPVDLRSEARLFGCGGSGSC